MNTITPDEIRRLFPRASKSVLAVNSRFTISPNAVGEVEPERAISRAVPEGNGKCGATLESMTNAVDGSSRRRSKSGQANSVTAGETAPFNVRPTTDEERLNKTEKAFLAYCRSLNYAWIGIQNITFKIGDDCRFTPDFTLITMGPYLTIDFIDVKGFQRDDALVKIKTTARMFTWARFWIVKRVKGCPAMTSSGWKQTQIRP